MERKGVYRKGRAGHARNVSSFRVTREHIKKYRFPIGGMLALLLVLSAAPAVGDQFQTSVVSSETSVVRTLDAGALSETAEVLCKGELNNVAGKLVDAEASLQVFANNYAEDFVGSNLEKRVLRVNEAVSAFLAFVQSCQSR